VQVDQSSPAPRNNYTATSSQIIAVCEENNRAAEQMIKVIKQVITTFSDDTMKLKMIKAVIDSASEHDVLIIHNFISCINR